MPYNARLITFTRSGSAFLGDLLSRSNCHKIAMGSHNLKTLQNGETLLTVIRNPEEVVASSIINELPNIVNPEGHATDQIEGYYRFYETVINLQNKIVIDFNLLINETESTFKKLTKIIGCNCYIDYDYKSVIHNSRGHLHSSKTHPFYYGALSIAKRQNYSKVAKLYEDIVKLSI